MLAGVAEPNAELRARFARDHDVPIHEDARELVETPEIDAVYIATPHQFHMEHAVLAADRGKHIVVEKPMALTLEECAAMIDAAERAGVALIVGHTYSFEPAIKEISRLASTGSFGPLAMLAMWNYTDFLYRPRRAEELDTSRGGGILFNQIPHSVDIARLLARSEVRSVRASTAILDPLRPTEGCCMCMLDFAGGAAASIVYSGYDHFDSDEMHSWVGATGRKKTPSHGNTRRALRQLGSRQLEEHARSDRYGYGSTQAVRQEAPEHQAHFGCLVATYERADLRTTADGFAIYTDDGVEQVVIPATSTGRNNVLDELCDAVFEGKAPVHDGRFAMGTMEATFAIQQSAQRRREVFLR